MKENNEKELKELVEAALEASKVAYRYAVDHSTPDSPRDASLCRNTYKAFNALSYLLLDLDQE